MEGRTHERVHRQHLPEAVSDKNKIRAKALPEEEDLCFDIAAAGENYPMENLGIQILLKGTWELIKYCPKLQLLGKPKTLIILELL